MRQELPVYAFDFDKTLTLEDSTLPFLLFGTTGWKRLTRRCFYYSTAVLVKLGLWTTAQHKQCWLSFYFRAWSKPSWQKRCSAFASTLAMHPLYKEIDWKRADRTYVILSASPVDWVRPFFPAEVFVFGSEVLFGPSGLEGISQELAGAAKLGPLQGMGIQKLEAFYTDHASDRPLAALAKQLYVVKGKEVIHCADMRSFDRRLGIK